MEVAKAHLSGWEFLTSPGAVCALNDWYGERGFQLLREAGFNWIWVTWSCGFAYESEKIQHEVLGPFIARCHAAGIHVTAYMSMCNLFYHDVAMKQPELLECMQRDDEGNPVPYGAAKFTKEPERVLACLNHPKWRMHLKNRLKSAIEAGAEAAFYDNLAPWCTCELCRERFRQYAHERVGRGVEMPRQRVLFSPVFAEVAAEVDCEEDRFQWQLLQTYQADLLNEVGIELTRYAESFVPEFMVYFNWHTYHQTFGTPELKALSTEDGVKCGYTGTNAKLDVYAGSDCEGYMSNAGLLRRMLATADSVRPLRIQSHKVTSNVYMESREFVPYGADDWKRLVAESWCYRAAQEVFLEGNFQTQLYAGEDRATEAWMAIAQYNRFQARHRKLWTAAEHSEVAFAVLILDNYPNAHKDWQRVRFLTALSLAGYQFDVILNRQLTIDRLSKYRLLWCPSSERLSNEELDILEAYLKTGGQIMATGAFACSSAIGNLRDKSEATVWLKRLMEAGPGRFQRDSRELDHAIGNDGKCGKNIPQIVQEAQHAFPIQVTADEMPLVWTSWSLPNGERLVFVLNPDSRAARVNVRIVVREARKLEWLSADKSDGVFTTTTDEHAIICRVPSLSIFGFCIVA
jgi:hypothetical protein